VDRKNFAAQAVPAVTERRAEKERLHIDYRKPEVQETLDSIKSARIEYSLTTQSVEQRP
jgi:hypothetical protein